MSPTRFATPKIRHLCQFTLVAALVAAGGLAAQPQALAVQVEVPAALAAPAVDPCDSSAWADAAFGTVVLNEDFDGTDLPDCWQVKNGTWTVANGRLTGKGSARSRSRITFGQHLNDYRIEVTFRFDRALEDNRWAAFVLDIARDGSAPWSHALVRADSSLYASQIELARMKTNGSFWVHDKSELSTHIGIGDTTRAMVEVHGGLAYYYIDGEEVLRTAAFSRSDSGVLGLAVDGATVSFDSVKVTKLTPATSAGGCLPGDDTVRMGHTGMVIAHRGNDAVAPDNTMPAIQQAVDLGSHLFEVDIRYTKDGVPVLLHDSTVNGTTNGKGNVIDLTLAQVKALRVEYEPAEVYPDVRIPTLQEVLDYMKGEPGAAMLLEFKDEWPDDMLAKVSDMIKQSGVGDRIIAQSFSKSVLTGLHQLYPELPTMLLVAVLPSDPVAAAKAVYAMGINPSYYTVKQTQINALHAAGLKIFVWTLQQTDDEDKWRTWATLGVDGVITDYPGKLLVWQDSYNSFFHREGFECEAPEPLNLGPVSLTGAAQVGQTLTLSASYTPASATATYVWFRGSTAIKGATSTTYRVGSADIGWDLVAKVTVTKGSQSLTKYSNHVQVPGIASVTVEGLAKVGQKLTAAVVYQPHSALVTYQWFRGSVLVGSGDSYVVKAADAGQDMVLKFTAVHSTIASQVKYSAHFTPTQ
ncbi:MAG: DUF1080 domain-containing protein [Bifidobacteriaceae bacterium]|jgi:glycerophosphoryl diester phosphodiesterase|nr:DUF1080 domain-containing protein [Bifidobacteriaceae bacterium]